MKLAELFEEEERSILSVLGKQPTRLDIGFNCSCNDLTSLEGVPSYIVGGLWCSANKFTSLHNIHKQIKHISTIADFSANPITSHVLGLLLIDGLTKVWLENKQVQNIIDKHLKGERDVFACQEELIEAGFEEFAKL